MSELGLLLKKARLERGYSLAQLEEITKIRKRYLEAIEEGNFQVLPGNFYVRAFIKTYAIAVGLDSKEVLNLYKSVLPVLEVEDHVKSIKKKPVRLNMNFDRFSKWVSTFLMIFFVVFIVGIVYYFWYHNHGSNTNVLNPNQKITDQKQTLPSTQTSASQQTEPKPKPPAPEPTKPELKLMNKTNNKEIYKILHADHIDLAMKATGDCWVEVDHIVDGKINPISQKSMKKGDSWSLSSTKPVNINVGRPINFILTVNGMNVKMINTYNPFRYQFQTVK